MDRRQLTITITAVALSLLLGVGITLLATSGDGGNDEAITSGHATTTSSAPLSTSPSKATTPSTQPIVTIPSRPPPSVVVIPPTAAPATAAPSTTPPTTASPSTAPATAPPTAAPAAPTDSPTTRPAAPATAETGPVSTAPTTSTSEANGRTDVGVSGRHIRVAVIADDPHVFEGARAWAAAVNRKGGIADRKLRIDTLPTGGTADGYGTAVGTACNRDFAIVAGLSAFDADTEPLDCGIPDIPIEAIATTHATRGTTYAAFPRRAGVEAVGPYRSLQSAATEGCCEEYVLVPASEPDRATTKATVAALTQIGFDPVATPDVPITATDADYDAFAEDLAASGATFAWSGLGQNSTIALRRAAVAAGVTSSTIWYCDARCYDQAFLTQGSAAVNGQNIGIETVPFSDRRDVPALRTYLRTAAQDGGRASYDGLRAYVAGSLFQEALDRVARDHSANGVTRAHLVEALAGIHDFTAGGLVGATDVGKREPNGCMVLLGVEDGRFARIDPSERGNLDCSRDNLVVLDD